MNKKMNKNSIGIIGLGFIGQILKRHYPTAKGYDAQGQCDPLEEVLQQDIIFIAFLTHNNEGTGIANYADKAPTGRIFIIKSTFTPGTCDFLQARFPQHSFIYSPEFLTEMTAWEDFTKPQFQILGCPQQSLELVHEVFSILPEAPIKKVISPLDAEVLKHAINAYFALKVSWFNQLYDATRGLGADYETIREIMVAHPWIGNSHSVIWHKGYRGYGGKCLSKDPKALAKATKFPLIDHIEKYNETLRQNKKGN